MNSGKVSNNHDKISMNKELLKKSVEFNVHYCKERIITTQKFNTQKVTVKDLIKSETFTGKIIDYKLEHSAFTNQIYRPKFKRTLDFNNFPIGNYTRKKTGVRQDDLILIFNTFEKLEEAEIVLVPRKDKGILECYLYKGILNGQIILILMPLQLNMILKEGAVYTVSNAKWSEEVVIRTDHFSLLKEKYLAINGDTQNKSKSVRDEKMLENGLAIYKG